MKHQKTVDDIKAVAFAESRARRAEDIAIAGLMGMFHSMNDEEPVSTVILAYAVLLAGAAKRMSDESGRTWECELAHLLEGAQAYAAFRGLTG